MIENKKTSIKKIEDYLESNGFKIKRKVWISKKQEFAIVIELQKSQWSDEYYVNAGIIFNQSNDDLLKVNKSQIQWRIIRLDKKMPKDLFNLAKEVDMIIDSTNEQIIKPFCSFETKNEIKDYLLQCHNRYLLTIDAKNILNINDEKNIF